MSIRLRQLIPFIILLFSPNAYSEREELQLRFNHLTVNDGLSQNSILAIAQDKFGFMWFGTWEGVNRFDGYRFQVYRADEDDSTALSNNRINAIVTDTEGNVWIQTGDFRYVFRFDYEQEHFVRYPTERIPVEVDKKILNYRAVARSVENKQFRWDVTSTGLVQTHKKSGRHITYQSDWNNPFSLSDHVINAIYLDAANNLWVGTLNGGVNCANLQFKSFDYYSVGSSNVRKSVVRAICQDGADRLWVGTEADGITVLDRSNGPAVKIHYGNKALINPNIRSLISDRYGAVWIGTKGGLDRFDPKSRKFRHYIPKATGSIAHPWIFALLEDGAGTLWVGSFDGLARYDRKTDRFTSLNPAGMLQSPQVRVLLEDHRHRLWVGTEGGGVTRLDKDANGRLSNPIHYRHQVGNPNSLINDMVLALAEDQDHMIWIGTNNGLCRLDPEKDVFNRFSLSNGFPDDLIMGLQTDGKGQLWISHKKGLTSMDVRTFKMRNFNQSDGLQGNEFTQNASFRNSKTGELFFGGTNGLNAFFADKISVNPNKPLPVLTGLKIMNQSVSPGKKFNDRILLEKSLMLSTKINLPWEDRNFSITFSSLNFDNPEGSRYKYRLEGIDEDWIYTDALQREATYTYLPSGLYHFEVFASNSDGVWSEKPASVYFRILAPWWFSWWAKLFYLCMLGLVLWLVYRYIVSRIEFRNELLLEKLRNEKNEELMDLKLQFFTEISHEFRTPLTLIIDPLERLTSGSVPGEKVQQFYNLMSRNARQLLDLINQLLDFRKVQSRNLALNAEQLDLVEYVREVAAAFEQRATSQQIRLSILTEETSMLMDFDADKIRKVLNNLISNAFRFTPAYGAVSIRLSRLGAERIRMEVRDSGPGIDPAFHDKIFEAFFQAGNAKSNAFGTGIGLALTKELVLLHGGTISVTSEKGQGSCFTVELPVHQEIKTDLSIVSVETYFPLDAERSNVVESTGSADKNGSLFLFVDDHEDIREYIRLNFGTQYEVVTACDGLEGFNKAAEIVPDVVVSDIMMDGMDGFELCKRLKSDERTSHIPVILLTARQTDESRIEGYGIGADAYITKPFNTEVLSARIINLLEQRKLLQRSFSQGSPLEIRKIAVNVTDEAFLNKTVGLIEMHMEDPDFDPDRLAELLRMSRSQLYRKIKGLTNRSVQDFITSIRMNKALEFLLSGNFSISETAYKVGFSLPTNFSRTFTKQFGLSPTKYLEKHKK